MTDQFPKTDVGGTVPVDYAPGAYAPGAPRMPSMASAPTMPRKESMLEKLAKQLGGADPNKLSSTLLQTAFKVGGDKQVTTEQLMSLVVVCVQHKLNPFTKEIYAYPDKRGGIIPIVSIDGWMRIINENPKFDGMECSETFDGSGNIVSATCKMHRKDRSHPTIVTEYYEECVGDTTMYDRKSGKRVNNPNAPWAKYPIRMLRHKAAIQCARYAFSFAGIYEEDEGNRIAKGIEHEVEVERGAIGPGAIGPGGIGPGASVPQSIPAPQSASNGPEKPAISQKEILDKTPLPPYPPDQFKENFPLWEKLIQAHKKTVDDVKSTLATKYTLTDSQIEAIETIDVPHDKEVEK